MAYGITLAMREIKKPEPEIVHEHFVPHSKIIGFNAAKRAADLQPYVNPARDLKPGRHLRKELRGKVQPTTVTLIVEEAA